LRPDTIAVNMSIRTSQNLACAGQLHCCQKQIAQGGMSILVEMTHVTWQKFQEVAG